MTAFHQILVSAAPGDAVTNAAFECRSLLRRVGPSEIFARYIDPRLQKQAYPLSKYDQIASSSGTILIFHASIGEPDVFSFIRSRTERLVLVYHNISPAHHFLRYDPAFAALLQGARQELFALRHRTVLALADSSYNAAELESLGYPTVRVSPLILDLNRLRSESERAKPAAPRRPPGPALLFVGQLLPHKRPDLLLQAFHVLTTHLIPEAHAYLVGPERLISYRFSLVRFIEELGLAGAHLVGPVTLPRLAAFFRDSDVFVTMSEHEGFCVPLVEAMAFDLPIIARPFAAIPDTLGDAGFMLPESEDPILAAEAIAEVLSNQPLRDQLISGGRQRLATFDPDAARAAFLEHMLMVA